MCRRTPGLCHETGGRNLAEFEGWGAARDAVARVRSQSRKGAAGDARVDGDLREACVACGVLKRVQVMAIPKLARGRPEIF